MMQPLFHNNQFYSFSNLESLESLEVWLNIIFLIIISSDIMTPKDMMVTDANADAMGIIRTSLMENAGRCLARRITHKRDPCKVAIFAGSGGNGGDGYLAAK